MYSINFVLIDWYNLPSVSKNYPLYVFKNGAYKNLNSIYFLLNLCLHIFKAWSNKEEKYKYL